MAEIILSAIGQFDFDQATAVEQIDFAFFLTVLHLMDYKQTLLDGACSSFRLDFKLYVVNAFLVWLNCPELLQISDLAPQASCPSFAVIFMTLNSGVFEHIDETVEAQLHGLVKSAPVMLLSQSIPSDLKDLTDDVDHETDIALLSKRLDCELNLTEQLALRRLKVFAKALARQKELGLPLQDPYRFVAAVASDQVARNLQHFERLVELKKAAIALQAELWQRLSKCDIFHQVGQLPQGCLLGVENPHYCQDQGEFESNREVVSAAMSYAGDEAETDGLLHHLRHASDLP